MYSILVYLIGLTQVMINYGILDRRRILKRPDMILVRQAGVFQLMRSWRNYSRITLLGLQKEVRMAFSSVAKIHIRIRHLRYFSLLPATATTTEVPTLEATTATIGRPVLTATPTASTSTVATRI